MKFLSLRRKHPPGKMSLEARSKIAVFTSYHLKVISTILLLHIFHVTDNLYMNEKLIQ